MRTRFERSWGYGFMAVLLAAVVATMAAGASAQSAPTEWSVPTFSSQPMNLAPDSEGNIWFTEFAGNKIGKVNTNGVFQEFTVPTNDSQPWGIAIDSSNRVWFTEHAAGKIGNLTPNGVFGQDNIPTANSKPTGIAIDASGNVWFAESGANKIGRFSTSNSSFEEKDIPTANSQPWALAIDSSGNVWFTERAANKIGKMTPSGQFTEYGIPTSGSAPTGIAIDGLGNIWFAEYEGNKIGMMTPTGAFTEYNIPTSGAKPTWVAVDKTGGVWYAGSGTNSFGRVANGTITEYGFSTSNSTPVGVAIDGSGNVWFTMQSANKIAKAAGFAPVATPTPVYTPQATPQPMIRDSRFFEQTGFRIDNDVFWDYFNKRGGLRTFGYPVSRTFTFLGATTQFFQREIMQLSPSGTVQTMNVLDPGLMEYTKINGSSYPANDQSIAQQAPIPGSPDYGTRIVDFVRNHAPDHFEGLNVNFYQAFQNTVTLQDAYPEGGGNPALLPLLNLEIWGVPTSRPARDPSNGNFVYLRFQRGIMHYDATTGYTQGLLLADYLKAIITGQNLPDDLKEQAKNSKFYRQYNPYRPNWVDRPDQLPNTNFFYAFERDGAAMPTPMPASDVPPTPTATPVPSAGTPPANIEVAGDQGFINQVNDALQMLADKSPYNYSIVKQNVYRIEWIDSSSCSTDYATHTLKINSAAAFPSDWNSFRDQQKQWLAGLIVHNAVHIGQYYRGAATTGADAEREALLRQQDTMAAIETNNPAGQFWKYIQNALENNTGWFSCWQPPRSPQND
ncbi:MAG: virginiamycin B lyase family protein [Chloroflexota bacterium]